MAHLLGRITAPATDETQRGWKLLLTTTTFDWARDWPEKTAQVRYRTGERFEIRLLERALAAWLKRRTDASNGWLALHLHL